MTEYHSHHAYTSRVGRHRAETRRDRFTAWVRRFFFTETFIR
jgi:hypothetical protein